MTTFCYRSYTNFLNIWTVQRVKESHRRKRKGDSDNNFCDKHNIYPLNIFQEEKRKRLAAETEFSPEDLSLATIPGLEFDPKERAFDMEELRPQPIIKKRSKLFVQDEEKVSFYDGTCY